MRIPAVLLALAVVLALASGCGSPAGASGRAAAGSPAVGSLSGAPVATLPGQDPSLSTSATTSPSTSPSSPPMPWIARTGHAADGIGIYLVHPDGSDLTWILADVTASVIHRPDWSPDGRRLAVEVLGSGDFPHGTIWVAAADGSDPHQVAACTAAPCLQLAMPAWSPDGTSLALVRSDLQSDRRSWGRTALEILDLGTGERRTIARTADGRSSFADPRWAPDGRSIVLEVDHFATPTQDVTSGSAIAVVATDGSGPGEPRLITRLADFGAHPDWSPEGSRIVFGTYGIESFETGGPGASNLYTIRPDGTALTQVTDFPHGGSRAGHPSWTPDGRRIIFTEVDGTDYDGLGARQTAFVDPDGSNLTEIEADALGTYPRLQPTP